MEITAQWVRVSWTKRSRGGPAAALRNGLPAGFALPSPTPPTPGFAHAVRLREDDDFRPRAGETTLRDAGLVLRDENGRLRVHTNIPLLGGLPPRRRRPPAVRLEPGQWVRWRLNYRFSSAAGVRDWSYWLDTFNVAYGPVAPDVFLGEPPLLVDECGPVR
ncbi:hypothetical protein KV205_11820 [Streptomyces sp. SKN60]|uniref:hypothetical protein n=1 Tax=Streptomyces sp. SKN60 TaxID=2855506 RepID=UPI002245E698|nr:hypothetical protein [Streptomyces sp. SKN60]MCX2181213.1 hypothetical protein [Streptomyces sp. SKN60]